MALELKHYTPEAHTKSITCLSYNPYRREIYSGSEDGRIRIWDSETSKLITTMGEHLGWVSSLFFCKDLKVLFSSSVDGTLVAWATSGKLIQKLSVGEPLYSMAYNSRRLQLLIGGDSKLYVFQLISPDDILSSTQVVDPNWSVTSEHSDIISCITSCEGRFYTGGFDRKIVIYDSPHVGEMTMRVISTIYNAHEAGISSMSFGKDTDNQWLISGSFDRCVKLWSLDGNLLQRFDNFPDTITSVCYITCTQSLWICANSHTPIVYDPRGGVNISDFVSTDASRLNSVDSHSVMKSIMYVPEVKEVVGFTNRRSLVTWRYNSNVDLTTLSGHTESVETLAFTSKEPILLFSGSGDGTIRKWERLQLNAYMYSHEVLKPPKNDRSLELAKKSERLTQDAAERTSASLLKPIERRKQQANFHRQLSAKIMQWRRSIEEQLPVGSAGSQNAAQTLSEPALQTFNRKQRILEVNIEREVALHNSGQPMEKQSRNKFGKGKEKTRTSLLAPPKRSMTAKGQGDSGNDDQNSDEEPLGTDNRASNSVYESKTRSVLKVLFYDQLDCLISAGEDHKIRIWMHDSETLRSVLCANSGDKRDEELLSDGRKPASQSEDSELATQNYINSRVAGLSCKYVLSEHKEPVTTMVCVQYKGGHYLLSSGWDQRLYLWNIVTGELCDTLRTKASSLFGSRPEQAADGIVLDMDYSPSREEYAYSSADKCAYIRRFSLEGDKMSLQAVLQGHELEVTAVKWHSALEQWITGSEDGTFRVWAADGSACLQVVQNGVAITTMAVDSLNGCILTGSFDRCMQVFDPAKKYEVVQTNFGHQDEIRSIIHIPSRNQYVTASADKTIRIWNAYLKPEQIRHYTYELPDALQSISSERQGNIATRLLSQSSTQLGKQQTSFDQGKLEQAHFMEDLKSTIEFLESSADPSSAKKRSGLTRGIGMGLDSV